MLPTDLFALQTIIVSVIISVVFSVLLSLVLTKHRPGPPGPSGPPGPPGLMGRPGDAGRDGVCRCSEDSTPTDPEPLNKMSQDARSSHGMNL